MSRRLAAALLVWPRLCGVWRRVEFVVDKRSARHQEPVGISLVKAAKLRAVPVTSAQPVSDGLA